jgi:hypothetical protein
MSRLALLALMGTIATTAACLMPRPQPQGSGGGGSSGLAGLSQRGLRRCEIRPHLFASWDDPVTLPPSCPHEGWIRQIVRDIHEIDACLVQVVEIRIALEIGTRGEIRNVSVLDQIPAQARHCVEAGLRGWELAPAHKPGEILVVYRPATPDS